MNPPRIIIAGTGIITSVSKDLEETGIALRKRARGLRPASLIDVGTRGSLPAGEIPDFHWSDDVPRTHAIALAAARQAIAAAGGAIPDAILVGTTSGGMPKTEIMYRRGEQNPDTYRWHGLGTIATYIAADIGCFGPALTVSTACSSSAVAIIAGMKIIRAGSALRVLAGGADAISMLTYHGFRLLQLIDPDGTRPLDRDRAGMSLGEGASFMLLEGRFGDDDDVEILGGAITCDAYHASSPHPEGLGAMAAMKGALDDAGVSIADVDYINLHGTGTRDNDAVESKAVLALFGESNVPALSSVKGTFGHSLGAAGAVECAVSWLAVRDNLIPANVGCENLDESLGIHPVMTPIDQPVRTVLSNSFGFGGNNASIAIGRSRRSGVTEPGLRTPALRVINQECITRVGFIDETVAALERNESCAGACPDELMSAALPPRRIRRLKRLSRMSLALADRIFHGLAPEARADGVFLGTAWGAQSESFDFLKNLFESDCDFASPTDFVGSVHNSLAAQIAIEKVIRGPNVTTTGYRDSFWQAVFLAGLLPTAADRHLLLAGLDEFVPGVTRLLDANAPDCDGADGGGTLLVDRFGDPVATGERYPVVSAVHVKAVQSPAEAAAAIIGALGGIERLNEDFDAVFAGISPGESPASTEILNTFVSESGFSGTVWNYAGHIGNFASAPATAVALACRFIRDGRLPAACSPQNGSRCHGILVIEPVLRPTAFEVRLDAPG